MSTEPADHSTVASAVALADRSAAAARALGRRALTRRGESLVTTDDRAPVSAAHVMTAALTDVTTSAALADAVGVRLLHSDPALHRQLMPQPTIARIVFELAEQLRCESLVTPTLPGVRRNLARLFDEWVDTAWATGAIETELGLHVLTVAVVLRSRLTATPIAEDLEDTIESTRFGLAETVGPLLRELREYAGTQAEFAVPARKLALLLAERFPDDSGPEGVAALHESGFVPVVPSSGSGSEVEGSDAQPARTASAIQDEYAVFTREYDRKSQGIALGRPDQLQRWTSELAAEPRPFPPSRIARIAAARFATPTDGGWTGDTDEGVIDPARLGEFVAQQDARGIFRIPATRSQPHASVTILLDCSGSMRRHQRVIAALCDLLGRGLELVDVPLSVLGFSTVDWHGGRSAADWRAAGSPMAPGRLGGTHHIVFAPANLPWRRARRGLPALLRSDLYAEGIDGEALQWAAEEAMRQDARRRVLLVVSDGGPMSTATREAQGAAYLDRHLTAVADSIERSGVIQLGALGVEADLSAFYRHTRTADFGATVSRGVIHTALDLITES